MFRSPRIVRCALGICLLLPVLAIAQSVPTPAPVSAAEAQRELRILKRGLSELNAGLFRYLTPAQFEAEFARAEAEVAAGSDVQAMYLIATRIAAAVRCGHTWTNPLNQGPALQAQLANLPALPLRLQVLENRLLITASADPSVPANAELLAIDGRSASELIAEFLPYLRADADGDGKRLSQLETHSSGGAMDRLLPLLHPPAMTGYRLQLRTREGRLIEVRLPGRPVAEREAVLAAAGSAPEREDWRLEIAGDTAVMTLPTFAFWNNAFDWRGFLDASFRTLAEQRVTALVLDLRQNEGGSDAIGDALLARLLAAPYTKPSTRSESAYERVPYALARYLDTWDFDFFDRTGKVVRGEGRNWQLPWTPARVVEPVVQPYRGAVVALIGPRMSSAGYLIARDLKASGAATLIGRRTGGNLRGLNGGQLAWLRLPHSQVSVDIPLLASFVEAAPRDGGVDPDIEVRTRLEDVAAGIDPDLVAARRWLDQHRASRTTWDQQSTQGSSGGM
jgi:C-terminal processing protease CtpA/Prc